MVRCLPISCDMSFSPPFFTLLLHPDLPCCLTLQESELRLAIQDIGDSLASVCAALAADPEEAALLEVT